MSDPTPKAGLLEEPTTLTINADAMKQLQAEVEGRNRAEAERKAAEIEERVRIKRAEPEPPPRALSIREYLDSAPIKSGHAGPAGAFEQKPTVFDFSLV